MALANYFRDFGLAEMRQASVTLKTFDIRLFIFCSNLRISDSYALSNHQTVAIGCIISVS
jgi:hypothetical protein